jgi:hypothetical protein
VGRRNLIRAAAVAALALGVAAPAAAAVTWRVLADGPAAGTPFSAPTGYVALDRAETGSFAARLGSGSAKLSHVDYSKSALVAIFGEFGCEDSLIGVSSLSQHGTSLSVQLVQKQPTPGTAHCLAIFGTYRVLAVPKASLHAPYPTRAVVTLARS